MSLPLEVLVKHVRPEFKEDFIALLKRIEKATNGTESMSKLPQEKRDKFAAEYNEMLPKPYRKLKDAPLNQLETEYLHYITNKKYMKSIAEINALSTI